MKQLRNFLSKWESIKKSVLIVSVLAFISDVKGITDVLIGILRYVQEKTAPMNWHDIHQIWSKAFQDETWLNFISKVALVWMFVLLSKDVDKTKKELKVLATDQRLLLRLSIVMSKANSGGLMIDLPPEDDYLYYIQDEFSDDEIIRLKELKAIPDKYKRERYVLKKP